MNGAAHLLVRAGTYYFNRRVPDHLVSFFSDPDNVDKVSPELASYFAGNIQVRYSLKTKDKATAKRLCIEEDFKFSSYQSKVEQFIKDGTSTYDSASNETIRAIAQTWLTRALQDDEERRASGITRNHIEREEEGIDALEDNYREALAAGDTSRLVPRVEREADTLLEEFQIRLDKQSTSYAFLKRELTKATLHFFDVILDRNRGEIIDTPEAPPVATPKAAKAVGKMGLDDLKDYWKGQAARNWKTVYDVQKSIDEFKALHGDLTIDKITKAHVVAYKDWLLGIGIPEGEPHKKRSPKTIEKRLAMLKTILQSAASNDKIPFNPGQGVGIPREKVSKKKRVSFNAEDLSAIFSGPVHAKGERPTGGAGEASYWLPLLALYMGIREGEAAQVTRDDLKVEGKIPYLMVINEEDKQLKTESSKRKVPVHPDLVKLGFLKYAESFERGDRLFPLVTKYRDQWAKAWGQWFGRYLRDTVEIKDPRKVFHSFRHTFKDATRAAGITEEVHDALTGHSNGGVGRMYGGEHFPLEPLYQAMKKISYKGLDLKHLMVGSQR